MTDDAAKSVEPSDEPRTTPEDDAAPQGKSETDDTAAANETIELRPNPASAVLFIGGVLAFVAAVAALIFAFGRHSGSAAIEWPARESASEGARSGAAKIELPPLDRTELIRSDDASWIPRISTSEIDFDDPALDQFASVEQQSDAAVSLEIPPEQRWEFLFPDKLTTGAYAAQLDSLGIELGVIAGDQIEYASKLSEAKSVKRTGPVEDEHRLYLSWNRGDLDEADRTLLANAEIASAGRIVLHFCSEETVAKLAELELAYKNQPVETILRTRFGVKPWRGRFEFTVLDQQTRD